MYLGLLKLLTLLKSYVLYCFSESICHGHYRCESWVRRDRIEIEGTRRKRDNDNRVKRECVTENRDERANESELHNCVH